MPGLPSYGTADLVLKFVFAALPRVVPVSRLEHLLLAVVAAVLGVRDPCLNRRSFPTTGTGFRFVNPVPVVDLLPLLELGVIRPRL